MDKKKQSKHDADYDRWGSAPGAIRVVKAKPKPKKSGRARKK